MFSSVSKYKSKYKQLLATGAITPDRPVSLRSQLCPDTWNKRIPRGLRLPRNLHGNETDEVIAPACIRACVPAESNVLVFQLRSGFNAVIGAV
jgi:hypothetical protein